MKKIFFRGGFAFALTFLYGVAWGQANPDSQLKYVDILPPSPGVAKIADYSRPDVGLSSGTAQFHLPITSINIGTVNIPIGLNYSSNGVKVDAISSRVGVDFQLEAGGAITRTVMGNRPDELSQRLNLPNDHSLSSRAFIDFMNKVASGAQYDAEPDMFSYSYCGTGGKFMLDSALNVYQIPKTNARIVTNFNGTDWNFKISDANGNEYYFGGTGYIETSKKYQSCSHPLLPYATPTAWFLQKIILYNGDQVTFNYGTTSYRHDIGASQTLYYQMLSQSQPNFEGDCTVCPVNTNSTCVTYIDVTTLYLKSIETNRGQSISLSYAQRNDCGDSLLTRVNKYSNGTATGTPVESFKLNYANYVSTMLSPPSTLATSGDIQNRYFLSSVTRLFNGNYINQYALSYNDPASLPTRLTFAQDHWGYFNGKSNATLVPKPGTLDLISQFPNATADREADTVLCKKGLLTKIQYVTGGYDSITYQSNTAYMTKTINPTTPAYVSGTVFGGTGFSSATQTIGTFTVEFAQTVNISLTSENTSATLGADFHYGSSYALSGPTPDTHGLPTGTDPDGDGIGNPATTGVFVKQIVLQPGTYTLTLTATGSITEASVMLTYFPGHSTDVTKNWYVGGSRVGQIVTRSFDGSFIGKKKYTYSKAGSTQSSAVLNYQILYDRAYSYRNWCWQSSPDAQLYISRICSYISMFSTSLNSMFSPSGNSVSYSFVSESFDDANGNGVIEHAFVTSPDTQGNLACGSSLLGVSPSNTSVFFNGKETSTALYKNTGSALQLVQKTTNYFGAGHGLSDVLVGSIVNRFYILPTTYTDYVHPDEPDPLECTDYFTYSPWITLDSVKVDEYGPGGEDYTTTTKYNYDIATLLANSISTIDSYGSMRVTNNYYSGMSSILGATSDQTALFTSMTGKNNIGQLVYQQKLVNGNPVSSNRVLLGQASASSPILPVEVKQTNTSSGVEESLFKVTKYDAYGNILERQNRDGVLHSFVWNYSSKYPIAETIGSAFSDMDATSFETNDIGGWTFNYNSGYSTSAFFTGRQSYAMTATNPITRTGLNSSQTYVVSFWTYGTNTINVNGITPSPGVNRTGWVYNEVLMPANSTSLTISGTGQIDELRLRPVSASMLTYTYDADIGMTSSTDANNVSTYYEYDSLNRLKYIKDPQGNIIKSYDYNYQLR